MSVAPPGDAPQSSGTAVARDSDLPPPLESLNGVSGSGLPSPPSTTPTTGEEQALELHEVIELQTFSERKAWIEQKIKFLEKMPPIEVFVGLDAIRVSAEDVPGLPTRDELKQWMIEHDVIEKETEMFDRGELTKLRQLTKAATQRNLSPADTDVIELTLTTIYELDRLLHLLRDRSENLELLSIRLTWEESRISAWVDRRKILEDLQQFLETRARWTPSVYDNAIISDEQHEPHQPYDPKRRSSVTSMASTTSDSSIISPGFSRSFRFKLAEILSRDAAQFTGRITSLRHGKIMAAGKFLDKLIDHSRKPVPEVLLDEQDKLEEKGIAEMEHIGKFAMSLVMQWRKADEIYVETMKDKSSAQNLLEEIETAKLHHPTARQSASFVSRADALIKRLALRANPASSSSTFPCPEHALFGDQPQFNQNLAASLSTEIAAATQIARNVDAIAKAYRASYEAVKRVENLTATAGEMSTTFTSIIARLSGGVAVETGDSSPPSLTPEACKDLNRHAAFLSILPSIIRESAQATDSANQVLRNSNPAILRLNQVPGIDSNFTANAVSEFQRLSKLRDQVQDACKNAKVTEERLREARKIWSAMEGHSKRLRETQRRVGEAMERVRWRQVSVPSNEPGGTPALSSLDEVAIVDFMKELVQISSLIAQDVDTPLALLFKKPEIPLNPWLLRSNSGLKDLLDLTTKMARLLESIQRQAGVMKSVHAQFNYLLSRIEDAKLRIESRIDEVLIGRLANGNIQGAEDVLQEDIKSVREAVRKFVDDLAGNIPFVQEHLDTAYVDPKVFKQPSIPVDVTQAPTSINLPFDLALLDNTVRADSNNFAMKLSGNIEGLTQAVAHFQLACIAKEVDTILFAIVKDVDAVTEELSVMKAGLSEIVSGDHDFSDPLEDFSKHVDTTTQGHQTRIASSFPAIRELLQKMDAALGAHDASKHNTLYINRCRSLDDAETSYKAWNDAVSAFKDEILRQRLQLEQLEHIRIAEEERIAAEETERLRIEQERLVLEEQRRQEEARVVEELRQAEIARIAAEEAEKARIEQEQVEAERQHRIEEERRVEELRQAEIARIAAEEAERARIEQERVEAEQRRLEEERRAEELRQAEIARIAAEEAEKARIEQERAEAERQRLEDERITEERRIQIDKDRIAAEEAEKLRLERIAVEEAERAQVERERLDQEERKRLEEERLAAARQTQIELDRLAAEEAGNLRLLELERKVVEEKARAEREKLELEERQRLEDERIAELKRIESAKEREAERIRLAMEEKLRLEEQLAEEQRLRAEKDHIAVEAAEKQRLELMAEQLRKEEERLAAEQVEKQRLERAEAKARLTAEREKQRMDEQQAENAKRQLAEGQRVTQVTKAKPVQQKAQENYRAEAERPSKQHVASEGNGIKQVELEQRKVVDPHRQQKVDHLPESLRARLTVRDMDEEDVFGMRLAPSEGYSKTKEMSDLQAQILSFRKRLRSISINEISRPTKPSSRLPDLVQLKKMTRDFAGVSSGVALLPVSVEDASVDVELRSLRSEVEASVDLMKRVEKLAHLAEDIQLCDAALSDLLEHIDSYPASPKGLLSSSHQPLLNVPPEDQLSARLSFTRTTIESMTSNFANVATDSRAIAEKARIIQTWSELEEMGMDRLGGRKSRPGSAVSSRPSSGRNSSASIINARPNKKANAYSNLSLTSISSPKRLLVPSNATPRRVVSGSAEPQSRPISQLSSLSSNRSVSGPLGFSLYGSTFASRQRTTSLSNSTSTPTRRPSGPPARSRAQTGQLKRTSSPTGSEASSYSHSVRAHSRSSTSVSTWSRAPRNSLSSLLPTARISTPQKKPVPRRTYVADPKNKLDVAVGDVVNKLPVGINIEGVSETWKDQSGKYWIGNQDPRLCFCRILRSQTVMVRVGGGWSELSKFIKDHFADSFRLIPESPPRPGAPEEKWISSATLLEAPETDIPPASPRTPEPKMPFVPSFSLSTPSGQSPHSMKSNSPSVRGSPLTPLQFIRRADVDAMLRPVTPSKPPTLRARNPATHVHTPARNSVWRP